MHIHKSQLNSDVNSKVNFKKNADSIVYAILEISMLSSHKFKTCGFT